ITTHFFISYVMILPSSHRESPVLLSNGCRGTPLAAAESLQDQWGLSSALQAPPDPDAKGRLRRPPVPPNAVKTLCIHAMFNTLTSLALRASFITRSFGGATCAARALGGGARWPSPGPGTTTTPRRAATPPRSSERSMVPTRACRPRPGAAAVARHGG